jgi:glycerol-3-phosphate cytidylyltransferase-like family protein
MSEMSKKKKDPVIEEYEKLKNEIIIEKVDEVFRTQPDNYISALEEIGFKYYEDDDDEDLEEANAKPENQNQKDLVAYFQGEKELSGRILQIFLEERDAENPNLPLIRKYFKKANQNLKSLILYGLDHYPGKIDLLSDLDYLHEFKNILNILITYYTQACVDQENLETFSELAQDFYYATIPDGYEALYALRDLFEPGTDKRKVIDFLIAEEEEVKKDTRPVNF